jgi:ATP-dependent helicase HrpB
VRWFGLAIEPVLPELSRCLAAAGSAVLQAPPGAGKTTVVPLALLGEPWLEGRRILLLEPRRLAARTAARRMAELLGESVGQTIGYRIRRDSVVGPRTRIEVVTEGILTRMLQGDPALETAGLVIFDEFHERSIHADLGLALTLESRAVLRPDLRVLVMSATIEGAPIAKLLGGAPVVTGAGRSFPVETRYLPRRPETRIEAATAGAVRQALAEETGDVLVFLPGQGEIRRTAEQLEPAPGVWSLHPLYGDLSQEEQDAAIRPNPTGVRRVVLATSIAETSLTIEGVRVVIDSGLSRVPRFSPGSGMSRLVTVRVSRASAAQRRGRAGRIAPGVCYRLWAAQEDHELLPRGTPEILEADLAPLALDLAVCGVDDPAQLAWLDPPPAAALAGARALLRQLGALDAAGRPTPHGRRMAQLGTHPRIAHLLLSAVERGVAATAATIAAIIEERDALRSSGGTPDADLLLRLELVDQAGDPPPVFHGYPVDRGALYRIRETARAWRRSLAPLARPAETPKAEPPRRTPSRPGRGQALPRSVAESPDIGLLLALAYPDRIAQRRPGQAGRFVLRNGQGAITDSPGLMYQEFLVAAELDGDRRESRIWLGAPLCRADIEAGFGEQIQWEESIAWDEPDEAVVAARRERLGALVLSEQPLREPDPELVSGVLLGWIRRSGLGVLPWTEAATATLQRLAFLRHALGSPWPEVSEQSLIDGLEGWLGPWLAGLRRRSDLSRLQLDAALLGLLGPRERSQLDRLAPTHIVVPSGSRIRVSYADPAAPTLAVRLQEVFGLTESPRVGGVQVTMQLLSPAGRPVQITRDLAGFWRTSYFDVKKEMKGRYPRHYWPDDPLVAEPTRRAKRRGE